MNAVDCRTALEESRLALDAHYRVSDVAYGGRYNEIGIEARKRVSQTIWLMDEIGKLLSAWENIDAINSEIASLIATNNITPEEIQNHVKSRFMDENLTELEKSIEPLETLVESFYWICGRARSVIRLLPELKNFESQGVRNTRNKLLEHPEGNDSNVIMTSFGWGGEQGPVIKALRLSHQTEIWPDQGLFVNSLEFATNLSALAAEAVERIKIQV